MKEQVSLLVHLNESIVLPLLHVGVHMLTT